MTHKDHIINILKEVYKGAPNPGEDLRAYLERNAEAILGYVPEGERPRKPFGRKQEE